MRHTGSLEGLNKSNRLTILFAPIFPSEVTTFDELNLRFLQWETSYNSQIYHYSESFERLYGYFDISIVSLESGRAYFINRELNEYYDIYFIQTSEQLMRFSSFHKDSLLIVGDNSNFNLYQVFKYRIDKFILDQTSKKLLEIF